jgi:RNA polymerase sigma-70 factor (ECF subfamily)
VNKSAETSLDDKTLVESSLAGNRHAFATVIEKTQGLVAQIVFKMISDTEDREDAVQEIYLKVYQHLPNFRFQSKLSTWIARIAYNNCINSLRKKKIHLSLDDESGSVVHNDTRPQSHAEIDFSQKQLRGILAGEVEKLDPVYKTLVTLYHAEELSYSEISEITALPEGTVKSYLFRARKMLRDNLLRKYKREAL